MKKKKGFTLIELLVVISIIALLLSILLPSLRKAKEQAQMVICSTRQKNVLTAVNLYAADWDSKLPPSIQGRDVNPRTGEVGWWTIPNRVKYYYGTGREMNGGSLIDQFGSYLAKTEYLNCPMPRQSLAWQDRFYETGDDETIRTLNSSYFFLWNYLRFEHAGLKPKKGGDELMIMDYFTCGGGDINGVGAWTSAHKMRDSSLHDFRDLEENIPEKLRLYMKIQDISQIPSVKLNCGFIDGHIERRNTADFTRNVPEGYFFPPDIW